VIRCQGPWRNRDAVEMATLEWVDWYNNRCLFEALGDIPPAKAESAYYATMTRPRALEWQNKPSTEPGAVQLRA
jgi:putative transposase